MTRARSLLVALGLGAAPAAAEPAPVWNWDLPKYFPPPRVPADNPMTEEKFQLGRRLFYDKRLSGNGTISCSSCHLQERAFTDGRMTSVGSTGEHTPRNAPSIAYSGWHGTLTWANPALVTLERQMENPLFGDNPIEMGASEKNKAEIVARFRADPDYRKWFAAAFPRRPIRSPSRRSSGRSPPSNAAYSPSTAATTAICKASSS